MAYILNDQACKNLEVSTRREWILTNGIGGFAMGTASGINTRRYHGLLIAAIVPPATRMVLLAGIDAFVQTVSNPIGLSSNQYPGAIYPEGYLHLAEFEVDKSARWFYKVESIHLEKTIEMTEGKNTVTLTYINKGSKPFQLTLRPLVCHKPYHSNFQEEVGYPQSLNFQKDETSIIHNEIGLYLGHPKAKRVPVQGWYYRFEHQREVERGLDPRDDLFCPCELVYELGPGEKVTLTASDQSKAKPLPSPLPLEAHKFDFEHDLTEAVGKFFVETPSRTSLIAGYPWFTDWGRDTMISLPGALIHTGKIDKARKILTDYSHQVFQGLIPNRFVESGEKPDYNTVDATLWFANGIYKTLLADWHPKFASEMLKCLRGILEWHQKGTLYGIKVDPSDGLLTQGEGDVQLTWMDAKIGDWVVTPRHGKPVEINGLWVNAMRIGEWIANRLSENADSFRDAAENAEAHFEKKFWHQGLGFYLDTVDPDDASFRPNQVIAMALPFSPIKNPNGSIALKLVGQKLLTPVGLRTLSPDNPNYRGRYVGPMQEMDSAYHQGTVWPWLLGPYVSALVKYNGQTTNIDSNLKIRREAKRILNEAKEMLKASGLGGISEVYDGDAPHSPNGCPWQSWSTAEFLRAWKEDCIDVN